MPRETTAVGKGYALWLTPSEPIFSRLAKEIRRLSRELGTPPFEPHVTLLGGIMLPEKEVLARSASLAGSLKPLRIELDVIGYRDEFFRCLFARAVPTGPVLKARQAAQEAFGQRDEPPYMPHASLVYGRLQMELKKKIAARLGRLAGQAFDVKSVALYRVSGPPSEWKSVRRFELQ